MDDLKIAITGANGFVGSHFIKYFKNKNFKNIVIVGRKEVNHFTNIKIDFEKDEIPENIFNGIDIVYHLAGVAHDTGGFIDEEIYYKINVEVSSKLLKSAIKSGVKKFIYLSSVKAGSKKIENITNNSNILPEGVYGRSKRDAELKIKKIAQNTNIKVVVLRPSLIYGENVKGNLKNLISLIKKNSLLVLPDTKNQRSMLNVKNLIQALLLSYNSNQNFKIYNINDNKNYNTHKIFKLLREKIYKEKNLISFVIPYIFLKILAMLGDIFSLFIRFPLNSKKLKKLFTSETYSCDEIIRDLGYNPTLNFEDAIEEMIKNNNDTQL